MHPTQILLRELQVGMNDWINRHGKMEISLLWEKNVHIASLQKIGIHTNDPLTCLLHLFLVFHQTTRMRNEEMEFLEWVVSILESLQQICGHEHLFLSFWCLVRAITLTCTAKVLTQGKGEKFHTCSFCNTFHFGTTASQSQDVALRKFQHVCAEILS